MRKLLTALLAGLLLTQAVPALAEGDASHYEDFNRWIGTNQSPGGGVSVVKMTGMHCSYTAAGIGGREDRSLVIKTRDFDGTASLRDPYLEYYAARPMTGVYTMEAAVYSDTEQGLIRLVVPYFTSTGATGYYNAVQLLANGTLKGNSTAKGTYEKRLWNSMAVTMDTEAKTVKAYFNGILIAQDALPSLSAFQRFKVEVRYDSASAAQKQSGLAAMDDLKVYPGEYGGERLIAGTAQLLRGTEETGYPVTGPRDGSYCITRTVESTFSVSRQLVFTAGIYRGGVLERTDSAEYAVSNGTTVLKLTGQLTDASNAELRTFLWEKGSCRPVVDSQSFVMGDTTHVSAQELAGILTDKNPQQRHPRLLLQSGDLQALRYNCKNHAAMKTWYAKVKAKADAALLADLPVYNPQKPLYYAAGHVLSERLPLLSFAYLIEQDSRYAQRVYENLEAAAQAPDWGTVHYLDVAATAFGAALAYDWCYDYLKRQPEQLETVENALIDKALEPTWKVFYNVREETLGQWTNKNNNWIFVCAAGIGMAALALGDVPRCRELSGEVLCKVRSSLDTVLWKLAPDGAWYEGPSYWAYSMAYLVPYIAALNTAAGEGFGLPETEGMRHTAYYPIQSMGKDVTFNLNDASEEAVKSPELFYFARLYQDRNLGGYRYYQLNTLAMEPSWRDLIWYNSGYVSTSFDTEMEQDAYYRGIEMVTLRSGYKGNIHFAGLHGGINRVEHGQIDAGTFVYETNGTRWAIDLGPENYNLYNYWEMADQPKSRWGYYRNRAEGHNTITLAPGSNADQGLYAEAKITAFSSQASQAMAITDLTSVLNVASAKRGIRLDKTGGSLIVKDELALSRPKNLYWFMHTRAQITLSEDKKTALLYQNGQYLKAVCAGLGSFCVMDAAPLPDSPKPDLWEENINIGLRQNANNNVKKLAIHLPDAAGQVGLLVYFTPVAAPDAEIQVPEVPALEAWR